MEPKELIQIGDVLVYKPKGFFGWVIRIKTWHPIAHVEVYVGDGRSVASRDGIGVGIYQTRTDQLCGIYRPINTVRIGEAMDWFWKEADGQKYDWMACLGFVFQNKSSKHRMMCSEFATRWFRKAGCDLFPGEDADKVVPFQFAINPLLKEVWQNWKKPS